MKKIIMSALLLSLCFMFECYGADTEKGKSKVVVEKSIQKPELSRMNIPKIVVEYIDEKTGKYPSEMTLEERADYERRKKEESEKLREKEAEKAESGETDEEEPEPTPFKMDFKRETVKFVSVKGKDPQTRKMIVKTREGKTIELDVPPYITVTKTLDISELEKNEEITVHYIVSEEENKALSISIGELGITPKIPVKIKLPIPKIPIEIEQLKGITRPRQDEGGRRPKTRALERLEQIIDTDKPTTKSQNESNN